MANNCQAKVKSSQGQVKKKVKKKERRLDFADSIQTPLEVLEDIKKHF